jgi:amidophosphoribosyltransferase
MVGAFSLAILTHDALFAARDPLGVRPLCVGKLGEHWVVASESCALSTIGAQFVREVDPGEIVEIRDGQLTSHPISRRPAAAMCLFEMIYFARPDSQMHGERLHMVRQRMGEELAREAPADADIVVGLPDSAVPAAIGYGRASGIPYTEALIKNRYIGRTFIQPDQRLRDTGVQLKFNALPEVLAGKRVVLVDDTIVRGTTSRPIVQLLRNAGGERGPHAGPRAADDVAVPPRRGPGAPGRADRGPDVRAGDRRVHRGRLDRLPIPGRSLPVDRDRRQTRSARGA